jgi:aspartokinase/homoserine dehydrogenase 1
LLQQSSYLQNQMHLQIRVAGVSNSRKMLMNEDGIDLSNWKTLLDNGENADVNLLQVKSSRETCATQYWWILQPMMQ